MNHVTFRYALCLTIAVLVLACAAPRPAAADPLTLTKEFTDDPVWPGGEVTLEFTLTNLDRDFPATSISFTDMFDPALSGLSPAAPLPNNPVGPGSTLFWLADVLTLTGGQLGPEGSASFSVVLHVPFGVAPGHYDNITGEVTAEVAGSFVLGDPAADTLHVIPEPATMAILLAAMGVLSRRRGGSRVNS